MRPRIKIKAIKVFNSSHIERPIKILEKDLTENKKGLTL